MAFIIFTISVSQAYTHESFNVRKRLMQTHNQTTLLAQYLETNTGVMQHPGMGTRSPTSP